MTLLLYVFIYLFLYLYRVHLFSLFLVNAEL